MNPRNASLARAWLSPGLVEFGQVRARPFSLGSLLLIEELGIEFGAGDPDEPAALYVWAHSAPLDQVLGAIYAGTWRKAFDLWEFEQTGLQFGEEVAAYLEGIAAEIEAGQVEVKERPRKSSLEDDPEPPEVVEPFWLAGYLVILGENLRASRRELLWFLPIGQAFQVIHAGLRKNRAWTVPPGAAELAAKVAGEEIEELSELCELPGLVGGDAETLDFLAGFDLG